MSMSSSTLPPIEADLPFAPPSSPAVPMTPNNDKIEKINAAFADSLFLLVQDRVKAPASLDKEVVPQVLIEKKDEMVASDKVEETSEEEEHSSGSVIEHSSEEDATEDYQDAINENSMAIDKIKEQNSESSSEEPVLGGAIVKERNSESSEESSSEEISSSSSDVAASLPTSIPKVINSKTWSISILAVCAVAFLALGLHSLFGEGK